jgi:hypothetical protein
LEFAEKAAAPPIRISAEMSESVIDAMSTARDSLRRLTSAQTVQLQQDLALVEERLQDMAILMRICYGEDSQPAIRADETAGAFLRLKWALERAKTAGVSAGIRPV